MKPRSKRAIFALLFSCRLMCPALASSEDFDKKVKDLRKAVSKRPDYTLSVLESRIHRDKKKYSVGFTSGLVQEMLSVGVQGEFRANGDNSFGVQVMKSTLHPDSWVSSTKPNRDVNMIGGFYRRYFGNSLFSSIGLNHRSVEVEGFVNLFDRRSAVKYEDVALSVHVGNQWEFEHFNVGFKWIGISVPVSTIDDARSVDTTDKLSEPSFNALNLSVGFPF